MVHLRRKWYTYRDTFFIQKTWQADVLDKNRLETKKAFPIGKASHRFNYLNQAIHFCITTQHFNCGLDETRTRDPLRDRQVF